jgi:parvulin-like peptidyl-prolyl isomerase
MAKRRNKRREEQPREETRKQIRLRAKDRERNRKVMLGSGVAIGLALLLVIYGFINEFVVKPNSALAQVQDEKIITKQFWKRTRLEKSNLENQLRQYELFAQQFGQSDIFASQVNQIQALLSSPFSLGTQVLDQMIEEKVIEIKAKELGVEVTDAEVEQALREEVAAIQGAVTEPQATATAEAVTAATATAELFTPTPTATVDASGAITATATPLPTPEPLPTRPLLDDALYQEGLKTLAQSLKDSAGMTIDEYKEVIRARLLRDKLKETVVKDLVQPTEEQVHVRHILIAVDQTADASSGDTGDTSVTGGDTVTGTDAISATESVSGTQPITGTKSVTDTTTAGPSDAKGLSDAEALALAQELRQRILDGEDFAALAEQYSDDPGSAPNGGDLGWSGRGRYVPEFEDAAFSLPVGEVSEPVKTQFGYHLIQVLERDDQRPKDENQLRQEEEQAFQSWLQEQLLSLDIKRPDDLQAKLPSNL